VNEFQREDLMDFRGVVPISFKVAAHDALDSIPFEVWTGKCSWIEQHFLKVFGEDIPVPDPEMVELMPTKEKSLKMQWREEVIDPSHPLWHPVVVGVFRLE